MGGHRVDVNNCDTALFLVMSKRGQGGCERRIEVFVKIQKKNFFLGGGGRGGGRGVSGRGRVGGGGGVRVDVKEELKFL